MKDPKDEAKEAFFKDSGINPDDFNFIEDYFNEDAEETEATD